MISFLRTVLHVETIAQSHPVFTTRCIEYGGNRDPGLYAP
jgi:hypothetical protein